jgi:hypothetical protein
MNSSEHIAEAILYLQEAAYANHSHLLLERRLSEWQEKVLTSARARAAISLLTEVHATWAPPEDSWDVPDLGHLRDNDGVVLRE